MDSRHNPLFTSLFLCFSQFQWNYVSFFCFSLNYDLVSRFSFEFVEVAESSWVVFVPLRDNSSSDKIFKIELTLFNQVFGRLWSVKTPHQPPCIHNQIHLHEFASIFQQSFSLE